MRTEITRIIIDNNGNTREIGNKIEFYLLRNNKCYNCLGTIKNITETTFTIANVELDYMPLIENLTIKYEEVRDGLTYVPSYS